MRLEADKEYLICDYCGNLHFPDPNAEGVRVLDEPSNLACPKCAVPLVQASVGGQRILYCNRCRGMLIGMDVFLAVIQDLRSKRLAVAEAARQPDWNDLDRHIRCPQCGEMMDTHAYAGGGNVIIDDCEQCSVNWLDYGELDGIVRAPDHEQATEYWGPQ